LGQLFRLPFPLFLVFRNGKTKKELHSSRAATGLLNYEKEERVKNK